MIITCPECNGNVSDKAASCPHCGFDFAALRETMLKQEKEEAAKRQKEFEAQQQKIYDAQFTPSTVYLKLPWPLKPLVRPFTLRGRAPRIEFWSFFSLYMVVFIGGLLCRMPEWLLCTFLLYGALCLFTCWIRRCHDVGDENVNGVVLIIAFICLLIPIIGWICFATMFLTGLGLLQPSQPHSNKNGPNPFTFYENDSIAFDSTPKNPKQVGTKKFYIKKRSRSNVLKHNKATANSRTINSKSNEPVATTTTQLVCPFCGQMCETEVKIELHQHVICPYCEKKFSYEG